MSELVKNATDQTFDPEVLGSDVPVLVDFWAPWCGPCRLMTGAVNDVAAAVGDRARVVKVNIDEAGDTAVKYGIESIPTFAVIHRGEVKDRLVGVVSKQNLLATLEAAMT